MSKPFAQDKAGRPTGIVDRVSHPYLMYDEIRAIPFALKECIGRRVMKESERIADEILGRRIQRIYLTECVSSYCAGFASSYVFNEIPKIPSFPLPSFEIINYPPPDIDNKAAVFVISHRGRTKIALEVVESLRPRKPYIIGITDVEGSPITGVVDDVSVGVRGEEPTYPKTRSWVGTVFRLSLVALMIAKKKGVSTDQLIDQLKDIPEIATVIINTVEEKTKYLAEKYEEKRFYVVGGGPNWATAQEGVLKLKEAGLVISEALEVEEIAHGHQLVLDKDSVMMAVAPPGRSYERSCEITQAAKAIGSQTLSITRNGASLSKLSTDSIELEESLHELFTPMVYIIPIQLLAYYIALNKKLNPDTNLLLPNFLKAHKFLFPS